MYTKLNPDLLEQFVADASNAMVPADLASKYNLSISTTHNYKRQLEKERDILFPNVHGRRSEDFTNKPKVEINMKQIKEGKARVIMLDEFIIANVGGVEVLVSKGAREVKITGNGVVVECV